MNTFFYQHYKVTNPDAPEEMFPKLAALNFTCPSEKEPIKKRFGRSDVVPGILAHVTLEIKNLDKTDMNHDCQEDFKSNHEVRMFQFPRKKKRLHAV